MGQFNTIPPNPFPPSSESAGSGGGGSYVLPVASSKTLGGVKVGDGLSINANGALSNDNPTPYTPIAYSTSEQDTGRKWIDGSAIYCKTYSVGALPNAGNVQFTNDIANFKNVIAIETLGVTNDGYSFSNDGLVMNYCNSTSFVFRTTFDATGYDGFVTVYYTKTDN